MTVAHHGVFFCCVMMLSACTASTVTENLTPEPDGDLTAVSRIESGGGAAGYVIREVLLQSKDGRRVSLGSGTASNGVDFVAWRTKGSLEVCFRDQSRAVSKISTADGQIVEIHQRCDRQ